jgi:cell division protein ZapA (FtsZ GTPase activity inhibitor)
MSDESIQARVAKVNLRLPIYRDKQTTLAIAEEVTARVAAMEEQAGRIDSQAFALQAAFAYAAELHAEKAARDADNRDLLKVLDRIAGQLARLLEENGE